MSKFGVANFGHSAQLNEGRSELERTKYGKSQTTGAAILGGGVLVAERRGSKKVNEIWTLIMGMQLEIKGELKKI